MGHPSPSGRIHGQGLLRVVWRTYRVRKFKALSTVLVKVAQNGMVAFGFWHFSSKGAGEWSFIAPLLDHSACCWCFRYLSITANYTKEWEKWWKNPQQVSDNTQLLLCTFLPISLPFLTALRIFALPNLACLSKGISFLVSTYYSVWSVSTALWEHENDLSSNWFRELRNLRDFVNEFQMSIETYGPK